MFNNYDVKLCKYEVCNEYDVGSPFWLLGASNINWSKNLVIHSTDENNALTANKEGTETAQNGWQMRDWYTVNDMECSF